MYKLSISIVLEPRARENARLLASDFSSCPLDKKPARLLQMFITEFVE